MSATIAERRAQLIQNRNARHIERFERTLPGATVDEALECVIHAEAAHDYPMRDAFIAWAEQLESKEGSTMNDCFLRHSTVSSTVNVRFRTSDAKIVAELVEERIATYANWIDSALESGDVERAKQLSAERRRLISHVRANFNHAFGV